jgi:pimeloyl-ACP methyl ester carboxylesterase
MPRIPSPILTAACILVALAPAAQAQYAFFDSDGVRIRYLDQGTGEPIVLMHGFTARIELWGSVLEELSQDYRVIAIDARGHGESDKPHDPESYGANMAVDAIRVLDKLQIDQAHIIGYSMGARLTGYLLANFPSRFATAILAASPPRREWNQAQALRAQKSIQDIQEQGRQAGPNDGQDYVALAAIPLSWSDQTVSDTQLINNKVPTLAIVGSDDEDDRILGLRELDGFMANYELIIVDGATHIGLATHPDFIGSVRQFLSLHEMN